jgi:WD40 repeat protein/uncharacterized caspase-like protein
MRDSLHVAARLQLLALGLLLFTATVGMGQRPQVVVQTGHAEFVRSVAFSPDGTLLASCGNDHKIKIWDVASGQELRTLNGHEGYVLAVSFSPDGLMLASLGYEDNAIKLWNVETGDLQRTITNDHAQFDSVSFSPDGKTLASGNGTNSNGTGTPGIDFGDVANGKLVKTLNTSGGSISALAFAADGKLLVSGNLDGLVQLWDPLSGKAVREFKGHTDEVHAVAVSRDGRFLASASNDSTARIWDAASGSELRVLKHPNIVTSVAFSPEGKQLASGCWDYSVKIWDVGSGTNERTLTGHRETVWSVAFAPNGKTIASGSGDRSVRLWEAATGQVRQVLRGHVSQISSLILADKGRTLASHDYFDAVKIWDLSSGKDLRRLPHDEDQSGGLLALGADRKIVVDADQHGLITLYDSESVKPLRTLKGHWLSINAVAFTPDGQTLASTGSDGTVKLWDLAAGRELQSIVLPKGDGYNGLALAFSADGKYLACGSNATDVKVWEVSTGKELYTKKIADNGFIRAVAFAPDGNLLVTNTGTARLTILNGINGAELRTIGEKLAGPFTLSADRKGVWVANADGTITLLNLADGARLRTLKGHSAAATSLVLSQDGKLLISGSTDSTIKLWDTDSNSELATLLTLDEKDWLVITPDGLFDGSPAAFGQILWRFSAAIHDVAPVEVFFGDFFYPNLLMDIVSGKRPRAIRDIAQKDRRQPQVNLTVTPGSDGAANLAVQIKIDNAAAGAQDVRLFRNGSLVHVWHGDVLQGKTGITLAGQVPVVAGDNQLTAYAFNRDNVKSSDATLVVKGAETLRRNGIAYVLAVGVNTYANHDFDLKYAVADAQDFSEEWRLQQTKLQTYARTEITSLKDTEATKASILKSLAGIKSQVKPEDAVVIYFAGHGTAQQNRFYLIPHDLGYEGGRDAIEEAGLKTILAHSISDLELETALEGVDAGQILMVIDACNSGQALESEEKRRGPMNSKGLAQLAYEKGMYILTAAQSYQAAQEASKFGHGFLTFALVEEGVKEGKADAEPKDGKVIVREWFDYATRRVPQLQMELMTEAQEKRGVTVVFVKGEEKVADPAERNVQRPRVFYRRELEAQPLVVSKP